MIMPLRKIDDLVSNVQGIGPCHDINNFLDEHLSPTYTKVQKQHLRDFICNKMTIISFWIDDQADKDSIITKKIQKNVEEINSFLSDLDEA